MKHILVPVDFSPTSAAALRFATYLAEVMDYNLEIVHVFDTLISTSQTLFEAVRNQERTRLERELREFSRKQVEPVLATFQGRMDTLPVVRTTATEGLPAATLLGMSEREETALIVMGGVGSGQGMRPPGMFGSVARNLASQGGCPVVLIPKNYGYPKVERMAVAFEEPADLRAASPLLRQVIRGMHPEVRYVHVRDTDRAVEIEREDAFLEMSFGPDFPSYTYKFDNLPAGKVVDRLLRYVDDKAVDLLVLGRKRRPFFERLFHAGHLKPVVRNCEVPVLIIPFTSPAAR